MTLPLSWQCGRGRPRSQRPLEPFPAFRRIIQRTRKTVRDRMVSIFITALVLVLAILLFSGIGLYFWQKTARDNSERILPPSPDFYGLFAEQPGKNEMKQEDIERRQLLESSLLDRARTGDKSALIDARKSGHADSYDRILNELVERVDSDAALLSLMSYVAQNELPVSGALAKAAVASWQKSPSREGTAKAVHFAALSDDAGLYGGTVELVLEFWRDGKLANVSADELRALFDGEFWILSARTRSSGAGFVLKRTLANARRELESHTGSPSVSEGNSANEAPPSPSGF